MTSCMTRGLSMAANKAHPITWCSYKIRTPNRRRTHLRCARRVTAKAIKSWARRVCCSLGRAMLPTRARFRSMLVTEPQIFRPSHQRSYAWRREGGWVERRKEPSTSTGARSSWRLAIWRQAAIGDSWLSRNGFHQSHGGQTGANGLTALVRKTRSRPSAEVMRVCGRDDTCQSDNPRWFT
jgi:hypothetical protein